MNTITRRAGVRATGGLLALAILAAGCGRDAAQAPEQAQNVTTGKVTGEVTVWAMGRKARRSARSSRTSRAPTPA